MVGRYAAQIIGIIAVCGMVVMPAGPANAAESPVDPITVESAPAPEGTEEPQPVPEPAATPEPTQNPTPTAKPKPPVKLPKMKQVSEQMRKLKLPITSTDGRTDVNTVRSLCTWRDLTTGTSSRAAVRDRERHSIMVTRQLPVRKGLVTGLNINLTCQTVIWVTEDPKSKERRIKAVYPASTGRGGFGTPTGTYRIYRETNRWHESTTYPGAMMYRPKYFRGGVALHGSISDTYVRSYPASSGCVRMLKKDVDTLWRSGVSVGTPVRVYGRWT
jgi:lipoprotein-anchoring transpeptidase ErfK/SrfK